MRWQIVDANTGALMTPPLIHHSSVTGTQISPDGEFFVTLTSTGTVTIWRTRDGRCVGLAQGFDQNSWYPCFSKNMKYVFTPRAAGGILWKLTDSDTLVSEVLGSGPAAIPQISDNSKYLALANNKDWLWRLDETHAVPLPVAHADVFRTRFDASGQRVAAIYRDGSAQVWSTTSCNATSRRIAEPGSILSAVFSRNGDIVVTGAGGGHVRLWDSNTGTPVSAVLEHHGGGAFDEFFSRDEHHLFISCQKGSSSWNLPIADEPSDVLQARCILLSGNIMAQSEGPAPVLPSQLKEAWALVEKSAHR